MRVIFEESDGDYFFEIILLEEDFQRLLNEGCLGGDFIWDQDQEFKDLNVFIRKGDNACHLLKAPQPNQKKDFLKMSEEKCTKENPKNKPSQLPIAKRVEAKKKRKEKKE